jgi:hypothetical protein
MKRIVADERLRAALRRNGLRRAVRHTWEIQAGKLLAELCALVEIGREKRPVARAEITA